MGGGDKGVDISQLTINQLIEMKIKRLKIYFQSL